MDRTAFFHRGLTRGMRGIEIGPSYRPLCPKSQGWNVMVVDHASRADLVAKYSAWNVDTSLIEDVDLVLDDAGLESIQPKQAYDYILASHVIEHLPNPLGFFRAAADLLKPSGRLRLAVPDKRFCFDLLKPTTTAGELIQAYAENRHRHTLGQIVDALMMHVTCNGSITFGSVGETDRLALPHSPAEAYRLATQATQSGEHFDVHGWVYTPSSFMLAYRQLAEMGLLPFRIEAVIPDGRHEFLVDAVRDDSIPPTNGMETVATLRAILEEQARAAGGLVQ
jgi:2-polyprenyl-3-methyl-5-hydroxy-6-metoxy-1,4-benzoquinol methylase